MRIRTAKYMELKQNTINVEDDSFELVEMERK